MHWGRRPGGHEINASFAIKKQNTHHVDVHPHSLKERNDIVDGIWRDQLSVVEPETNPQVIHENRKPDHHGGNAPRPPKLIPAKNINGSRSFRDHKRYSWCWSRSLSFLRPSSLVVTAPAEFSRGSFRWRSSPFVVALPEACAMIFACKWTEF